MIQKKIIQNIAIGVGGVTLGGFLFSNISFSDKKTEIEHMQQAIFLAEANKAAAEAEKQKYEAAQLAQEAEAEQKRQEAELKQQQEIVIQQQAQQRALSYAEAIAPQIVKSNWVDGVNIRHQVYQTEYNSLNNTQIIKIGIAWQGAMDSSNEYWAQGIVNVQADGNWTFSETALSSNLQDFKNLMTAGKLGAELGGFLN